MYTPDEINLICIFDTSSRMGLICDMENERQNMSRDDDGLQSLTDGALSKLRGMSDDEYDASRGELFPDWEPYSVFLPRQR